MKRSWWIVLGLMGAVIALSIYLGVREPEADFSVGRWEDKERVALYDHMMRMDGFEPLDAEGLRSLLDHTFYNIDNGWVIYYDAEGNGRMRQLDLTFADGTNTDEGYREITSDGRYCTKWKKLRGGLRRCGRVWRKGDLYYGMLNEGYIGSKYTVHPGNPEGL